MIWFHMQRVHLHVVGGRHGKRRSGGRTAMSAHRTRCGRIGRNVVVSILLVGGRTHRNRVHWGIAHWVGRGGRIEGRRLHDSVAIASSIDHRTIRIYSLISDSLQYTTSGSSVDIVVSIRVIKVGIFIVGGGHHSTVIIRTRPYRFGLVSYL